MATNYDTCNYLIYNQQGDQRGPFPGKTAARYAAELWQYEIGQAISVHVEDTGEDVASLWPNGAWMLPDRHDENGDHLPRMNW